MAQQSRNLIAKIVDFNNRYRDEGLSVRERLLALWEMGDRLVEMGVKNPHAFGWQVQRETRGLIKRPTVFRAHKIRTIWPTRQSFLTDVGEIRGISALTEMLPLIDPAQQARHRLSKPAVRELFQRAASDNTSQFKRYLTEVKAAVHSGRLGVRLNRDRHLADFRGVIEALRRLSEVLIAAMSDSGTKRRDELRRLLALQERRAFANMCIALTTPENRRLDRRLEPAESTSELSDFRTAYDFLRQLLNRDSDVERARLRRLISAEMLAQLSDLISSIGEEATVADFRARQALTLRL